MNKYILSFLLASFVLVGCSPPPPPPLNTANPEASFNSRFPVVNQDWEAITAPVPDGYKWNYEWVFENNGSFSVSSDKRTRFFYYAHHSSNILVKSSSQDQRFKIIDYLIKNGVPAKRITSEDDIIHSNISIVLFRR